MYVLEREQRKALEDGNPELVFNYDAMQSGVGCIYLQACCLQVDDLGYDLRSRLNSFIYTNVNPSKVPLFNAKPGLNEMKPMIISAEEYFIKSRCNLGEDLGDLMKKIMSVIPTSFGDFSPEHAVEVSAVVRLSIVYRSLIGYVDSLSKAYSSGSLVFRETYISIVLFQGAYIWIKSRDVIPKGAVYHRPGSSKYEPRIKLPLLKSMGSSEAQKSRRLRLGSFGTHSKAEIVYRIAAIYCGKAKGKDRGRLDLGDGRYFTIPAMSEGDRSVSYREKVEQVEFQVMKVYKDFEAQKASRYLPPTLPGPAEMPKGDDQGYVNDQINLATLQCPQPYPVNQTLNPGTDIAMQVQFGQLAPNTDSGFNFSNQESLLQLLVKTQHELIILQKQQLQQQHEHSQLQRQHMELLQQNSQQQGQISALLQQNQQQQDHILVLQQQLQIRQPEQELAVEDFVEDFMQALQADM